MMKKMSVWKEIGYMLFTHHNQSKVVAKSYKFSIKSIEIIKDDKTRIIILTSNSSSHIKYLYSQRIY